jgi:hypothetical protein
MKNAVLGPVEWERTLDNLTEWANYLDKHGMVTKKEAFERIAKLLNDEHFGIEHIEIDNFSDMSPDSPPSISYLNMGDTYATTLILADDYTNGVSLLVSSWGDWMEECERHHCEEFGYIRCANCGHFASFDREGGDDWRSHQCEHCDRSVSGGN